MKITIKLLSGVKYSITIPDNSTVRDLFDLAKIGCPTSSQLPSRFKLSCNGIRLTPHDKYLLSFNIKMNDLINVYDIDEIDKINSVNSIEKVIDNDEIMKDNSFFFSKKKKSKCTFEQCSSVPLKIVGICDYCQGNFCSQHRLLENHLCKGLQSCKDNAYEKNAIKLHTESTITNKV